MRESIYFPGLNGIRFLAALSVVIFHIEQTKQFFGLIPPTDESRFFLARIVPEGGDAVILFFVLSGFLITYLLLAEHQTTSQIDVKKFYIRRILRIWPLYYLATFIGFVIVPAVVSLTHFPGYYIPVQENFTRKLGLFLVFLPNLELMKYGVVVGLGQFWTIGVEEQFYLIWPALMKKFVNKLPACFIAVIAFKGFWYTLWGLFVSGLMPETLTFLRPVSRFFTYFVPIECMAIGAMGAYILFRHKERILKVIFHPLVEKLVLVLMICNALFLRTTSPFLSFLPFSVLYLLFILNVSSNPNSTLKLENKYWNRLGKYSYGMYVYHMIVIYVVLIVCYFLGVTDGSGLGFNLLLYVTVIGLTILIAGFSYEKFEYRFLRLKTKVEIIQTGESMASRPQPGVLVEGVPLR